ncbi:EamA family transporter [Syntrophomonas erecta]
MVYYYLPIVLTIVANVFYHIFQKSIPEAANPMLSLIITYLTATLLSVLILLFGFKDTSIIAEIRKVNWASYALGVAIIGLELGFLLAYRAGWNVSLGALISNIAVSVLLIPIGIALFKETLTMQSFLGIVLCVSGLILINK